MTTVKSAPVAQKTSQGYLFAPAVDFFCLGGGSLLILPLIILMPEDSYPWLFAFSLILANFINHPHFAHSYQIFYRDFGRKIKGGVYPKPLQYRYIFSGLIAPVLLVAFFVVCVVLKDVKLLGYGANVMLFFVGWHYAKQGYGILIVDSVYKKLFFSSAEKKIFLVNAYINWFFFWLYTNLFLTARAPIMWGISYYALPPPKMLVYGVGIAAGLATLATFAVLIQTWRRRKALPFNGITAYFTSIYIWLWLGYVPLAVLYVPAFHSLQYLAVVWRYEMNAHQKEAAKARLPEAFKNFLIFGFTLGLLGFWIIPFALSTYMSYDRAVFGTAMFVFMFWVFINIHHYFMDNVIWRRENPDTKKYLFG
jgi:hypothetical protein